MSKTANINIRIEPEIKQEAEDLFGSFGISVTDAINIFIHTSLMEGGFPFAVKQPRYNSETEAAIREVRDILNGNTATKSFTSAKDLFADIEKDETTGL